MRITVHLVFVIFGKKIVNNVQCRLNKRTGTEFRRERTKKAQHKIRF